MNTAAASDYAQAPKRQPVKHAWPLTVILLSLALVVTPASGQNLSAPDSPDEILEKLLQDQINQMNVGATKLLDAVDKAEKANDGETKTFILTEKKTPAEAGQTKPEKQEATPAEVKQAAVDITKINMMEAAKHHTLAQELLQQAKAAPTPQVRRILLQKAKQSINTARQGLNGALEAARNVPGINLEPLAPPQQRKIKPIDLFRSKTFNLLGKIEATRKKTSEGELLPGAHRYDSTAIRKSMGVAPLPQEDPTLKGQLKNQTTKSGGTVKTGKSTKPSGGTGLGETPPPPPRLSADSDHRIRLGTGQDVDLSGLRDAITQVAPQLGGSPLFRTAANGDILGLNFDVLRVLANPTQWAALAKIGGVSLEATFDVLDMAKIIQIAPNGGLDLIEGPVLISLKNLYAKTAPFTTSGWDSLPEELRYPGMIQRVKGFTLDEESQDVILIGEAARTKADRIDIDSIILTLRTGWRDGTIMAVSLDPDPQDFGGPQYPVVINVPRDSIAAKIMLEADYAMKKIMFATGFATDQRLVNISATLEDVLSDRISSRYWLSPVPLGPGGAQVSSDGRTLLVNAQVQTQTEELFLTEQGSLAGAGRAEDQSRLAADAFSQSYGRIEIDDQVRPRGIYMQLHGLIDMIAVAKFIRSFNINYPILDQVSALPYRRLDGDDGVPSYYPGITNQLDVGQRVWKLTGGVQMDWPMVVDQLQTTGNEATRQLSGAVVDLRSNQAASIRASAVLTLARPRANGRVSHQATVLAAKRAAQDGDYARARTLFGDVFSADPSDMEALIGYTNAEIGLGNLASAAGALRHAMALSPDDDRLEFTAYDLALRHDPRSAFAQMATRTELRRRLNRHYTRLASKSLDRKDITKARQLIDWAIDIWEDNGDSHIVSAQTRSIDDARKRRRDNIRAIRAYRKQVQKGDKNAEKRLAIALSTDAWLLGERAGTALNKKYVQAGANQQIDVSAIITDLEGGILAAREAWKLDSALPNGLAAEASLMGLRAAILGETSEFKTALGLAGTAIEKFPDHPVGLIARGQIYTLMEDFSKAKADLTKAIKMAPGSAEAYLLRAAASLAAGDCQAARTDIETFVKLAPPGFSKQTDLMQQQAQCR